VGSSPLTEAQHADIDYITKKILGMSPVEESAVSTPPPTPPS